MHGGIPLHKQTSLTGSALLYKLNICACNRYKLRRLHAKTAHTRGEREGKAEKGGKGKGSGRSDQVREGKVEKSVIEEKGCLSAEG